MRRVLVAVAVLALTLTTGAHAATPTISARITPANPLFGDTATYVVEATVDPAALAGARIVDGVAPFTRVSPARVTRTVADGVGHITVTETIACLSAPCVAGKRRAAIALPLAQVASGGSVAAAPRVEVRVGSRVTDAAVKATTPAFSRPAGLPRPSYRFSPGAAQALLVLLGLGLVVGGAIVLTAPLRRSRAPARHGVDADQRRRAARLLRESVAREPGDRRRAASLAARVVGEPDLAGDAAAVAWSRPAPGAPDAVVLADRVEQATGSGSE